MSTFRPGIELKILEHITFDEDKSDLSALVRLSSEELKEMETASISTERTIYDELCTAVNKWQEQAAKTVAYQKAQEYLKVLPVEHTANQWTTDGNDHYEMSNKVYRFTWRVYERTKWDRARGKSVPTAWELTWGVYYNTVSKSDRSYSSKQIAGQNQKVFKDRAAMEKYLQGRITAYAHLFTEISPPVPEDARRYFYVNGVLLPGYTIETPEPDRPDEKDVDDLLDLLDDDDMDFLSQPEEPEPAPEEPPQTSSPPKSRFHRHRDTGPVR